MAHYLLIKKINVQNALAMQSLYTVGFPAVTGIAGAVHALERNMQVGEFKGIRFPKFAVSVHNFEPRIWKNDYNDCFIVNSSNPLRRKAKDDYVRPSTIEKALCHMRISLLIAIDNFDATDAEELVTTVAQKLKKIKVAGGDILTYESISVEYASITDDKTTKALLRNLMPGYVLTERRDLLCTHTQNGNDALDDLIDYLAVEYEAVEEKEEDENDNKQSKKQNKKDNEEEKQIKWAGKRKTDGWIIPIMTGYKDLFGAIQTQNQRDKSCEHHFVEPLITLGEFRMPYHFASLDEILWAYRIDTKNGLYLCQNQIAV